MSYDVPLQEKIEACPPPLRSIIEEFRLLEPRERLELLLDFSMELPDLPAHLHEQRDSMEQVHECQTPVFLSTEIQNNEVIFHLDIPEEAPTVRGYAAAVLEGLAGASPTEVLDVPEDVYMLFGLHEAITPQRLRGLHALLIYMKRQVRNLL